MIKRGKIDDTLAAMFSNIIYKDSYLFYAHMIGQCSIKLDDNLPAPAGITYSIDHFNLFINRSLFDEYTLQERLAILKHEMLHILYGHINRLNNKDMFKWNLATDCAINQLINLSHLPEGCILPDNLFKGNSVKVKLKMTAEYYYDLILENKENLNENLTFDDLQDYDRDVSSDVIKEMTKEMIKKAIDETKNCGSIPSEVQQILELKYKREINWRKELQKIIGKLKTDKKKTIMKPNRRNPNRKDLYGNKKDVKNEILVITDESGSVSDKDEAKALSEIISLCQMFKIDVDLIRVDTEASDIIKLNKNSVQYSRLKSGGTYLSSAIKKIKKDYDIIIIATDGELQQKDFNNFKDLNKEIIWLIINPNGNFEFLKSKMMKLIHIKYFKG